MHLYSFIDNTKNLCVLGLVCYKITRMSMQSKIYVLLYISLNYLKISKTEYLTLFLLQQNRFVQQYSQNLIFGFY